MDEIIKMFTKTGHGEVSRMLGLQYFSFEDLWSPLTLALCLIIAAAYLVLV